MGLVKDFSAQHFMETRLQKEIETRWDTCYDMLKLVLDHFEQLKKYAILKECVNQINHALPAEVCAVLEPLKRLRMKM